MPIDGAKLVEAYRKLDGILEGKGAPSTSPAWLAALERFWTSGCLRLTVRKGRQVGASTIIAPRVTVATSLFGSFDQSRASRGTIGFWSTRQKEADERLFNIERTFFDVGVRVKVRGDMIEVPGRPVIIQSYPSTSDVARGGNYWMVWEDEMPAWLVEGANPASERDAAIVPGCAMHENARIYSIGTPLGHLDFHAQLVAQGDTESQRVFSGPSWYWNPTLTEARTRALQPIERVWLREFAAIPQGDETSIFRIEDVDRAMRPPAEALQYPTRHERFIVIDPSRGVDDWTYAVARWTVEAVEIDQTNIGLAPDGSPWCAGVAEREYPTFDVFGRVSGRAVVRQTMGGAWLPFTPSPEALPRPTLHVEDIGQVPDGADTDGAVAFLAKLAHPKNWNGERIRKVYSDQYEFGALSSLLKRAGLRPSEQRWSASTKSKAVDRLERWLRDARIRLPAHQKLRTQLLQYSERITRTGILSYGGSGKHDDYAQVLVTLALASVNDELPGDPHSPDRRRHELGP